MKKTNPMFKFQMSLLFLLFSSMACTKKGEDPRITPSTSSTSSRNVVGVSMGSGVAIATGSQNQALRSASDAGLDIDWIQSDKPVLEETNQGQKYFYVVNLVRINGVDYEIPSIHYFSNRQASGAPLVAQTGLFSVGDVDLDLDAECLDNQCREYSFSIKTYKASQRIQQLMVYIDFVQQVPLIAVNDKNYFMNFTQFYDLIRNYYN